NKQLDPFWKNASIYFLLTDRFHNGNPENDQAYGRKKDGAVLRSFEGGDIQGVTQKIKEGYFNDLGVDAIWMTPVVDQVKGYTDEGTGKTYAFHGYWARDWTMLDPNFGSEADFKELVETAHAHGIRILMDIVMNHIGPVTATDPGWPKEWTREDPTCTYTSYASTVECTLVENLPDILTESNKAVELPPVLKAKWEEEGRLEQEMAELDAFFKRTGFPRAPRYYLMKWISDWVREYGIDGFRIDTAKHTEAGLWDELKKECEGALEAWKAEQGDLKLEDKDFYMMGEVYNYFIEGGRDFDYGDQKVDFYDSGFDALINFSFKNDATKSMEKLFSKYDQALNKGPLSEVSVLNYLSSHDDGAPFDQKREKVFEAGTKLMLSPGAVQIYYGDESGRDLNAKGAEGDAKLRSYMNWEDLAQNTETQNLLAHWQKLGKFRQAHQAVGAGKHQQLQAQPYMFSRKLESAGKTDQVLVAMDQPKGSKEISVFELFEEGEEVMDYYSGKKAKVKEGKLSFDTPFDILLIGQE
ncbi:MAG: alpha-amylase family glycosyl hydrolase, partial [Bacteroidota bacterium]